MKHDYDHLKMKKWLEQCLRDSGEDANETLDRFIYEVAKYPAVTNVEFSKHIDFDSNRIGIRAFGWSEKHQRHFHCTIYIDDENVLDDKSNFDAALERLIELVDLAIKQGPPEYDCGKPLLVADNEIRWRKN